jgi:hypothetical protein
MKQKSVPEWFVLSEELSPLVFQRLSFALSNVSLPMNIKMQPLQAFWHVLNVLHIANQANREGMHANALSITRQCIECISIIELGLSQNSEAFGLLERWNRDGLRPGDLRAWLEKNIWPAYGLGLWSESWSEYMAALAKSLQPYAHYSAPLSQWYGRLHEVSENSNNNTYALLELGPKTYDPQKATRITLYHALIVFTLARIWAATAGTKDTKFRESLDRFRIALGNSRYLDGESIKWDQQFWAMMWFRDGDPEY